MNTIDAILSELQTIKSEVRQLLNDGLNEPLSSQFDAFSDHVKTVLDEIGASLKKEEREFDKLVAAHPLAITAMACLVGFALGTVLRKSR